MVSLHELMADSETSLIGIKDPFRRMVETVQDYGIFLLDPQGHVASWNPGAARIKGYAAAEIIGRHFSVFYPSEAIERRWPQRELEVAAEQGRFEDEGWRVRKEGSQFWANVVITPVHDHNGVLRGYAKVTRDLSERRRIENLESTERQTQEFLAMLAHELRNPLAPISNALTLLARKPTSDPMEIWVREVLQRQTAQLGGLGVGLTLVQRLVQLHDGTVEARSQGAGRGSEFVVRLPLRQEPAIVRPSTNGHAAALAGGTSRRILVVDDNRDAAQALRLLLEGDGHQVRVAADGPSGLALAREYRPEVALLDIGLPEMNGYELAQQMRADPALSGALLVAVTAYGQMHDRTRASASGFHHHLVKPVDFGALQQLLRETV